MNTTRTIYFDYLRVIATFAVMLLHTSGNIWQSLDVHSYEWQVLNVYDSISRWGVPIFVMISGAIFLSRTIPVRKLYTKYILRIAIAYFAWSTFYASLYAEGTNDFIHLVIAGHFHLWFLPMIIGLYMIVPLLKPMAAEDSNAFYFVVIAFIFTLFIPTVCYLSEDFAPDQLNAEIQYIKTTLIPDLHLYMVLGFSVYFVAGYLLNKRELSHRSRVIIYITGLAGAAFIIGADAIVALKTNTPCSKYYENLTVGVFFVGIAVFTFLKYHHPDGPRINHLFARLSKYSFGAFLVHAEILELLEKAGLHAIAFDPLIAVPVTAVTTFIISFAISAILNQIPVIKKYIV